MKLQGMNQLFSCPSLLCPGTVETIPNMSRIQNIRRKLRPKVRRELWPVRIACAQHILANRGRANFNCDNDEKYFVVPQLLKCDVLPDEDITQMRYMIGAQCTIMVHISATIYLELKLRLQRIVL